MRTRLAIVGGALLAAITVPAPATAQPAGDTVIDAVRRRDERALAALIRAQADINRAQPDGATALAWAIHLGERRMAETLLGAGARVNVADEYGETPLTLAAANGDVAIMYRLLELGARPNAARWNGETPLMIAAGAGSVDAVQLLARHGAELNAREPRRGQTALAWAAAEGHSAVVKALVDLGADLEVTSNSGFTPLAFAVGKGDVDSVRLLLASGLDPNLVLPSGNSLLRMAMTAKQTATTLALIEGGADIRTVDRAGLSPLHVAAQAGDVSVVKALLARGASVNARTPPARTAVNRDRNAGRVFVGGGMQTPLMQAAQANQLPVMRALVEAGADATLTSDIGGTLLMFAAGGTIETAAFAYEIDPRVDGVTSLGQTPMHGAISGAVPRTQAQVCEVIQFLADKGAALDELDASGRTALSIADGPPIDKAVALLTSLIIKSGKTPKIPSQR